MKVGHGCAPLPVPDGTAMAGYAARTGPSTGVLEPLQVDCVMLGGLPLIVAEVLQIDEETAAAVRARVPGAWVAATHTHAGPDPDALREGIVDAAVRAHSAVTERELSASHRSGFVHGIGSRRNGGGAPRVRVDVLRFTDEHGGLAGVLAVVPVHPTVLPPSSTLISGDLTGAIRAALQAELGTPWVVVATGAAGDISTRRTRRRQTADECRRLGKEAARQISPMLRAPAGASWSAGVAAPALRRLSLPARRSDPAQLAAMRTALEAEYARSSDRTLETTLQGIEIAAARHLAGEVTLVLSAAKLGPLPLFGVGAEPFHSLRDELPGTSVLLGYVNGHAGYLPDADAYDEATYEVLASPLCRDAAATALDALIDLLPDENGGPR